MRKLVLFMHCSLDGFVAGPDGGMDWIRVDEEMFDYAGMMTDQSDTALYGRVTYEMMDAYWPAAGDKPDASKHDKQHSAWYNGVAKVIVSRTLKNKSLTNTQIISDNIEEHVQRLKQQPGNNIVMFGSPSTSHALMQYNLIDEYWLFINPIFLGSGISLFKNIPGRIDLELVESKKFSSGVMMLHYKL